MVELKDNRIPKTPDLTKLLTVLVGPEEKRFTVHEEILCQRSKFFKCAVKPHWAPGDKVVKLPEDDPALFEAYLTVAYTNTVPIKKNEDAKTLSNDADMSNNDADTSSNDADASSNNTNTSNNNAGTLSNDPNASSNQNSPSTSAQDLPRPRGPPQFPFLVDLYVLADKYMDVASKNVIMTGMLVRAKENKRPASSAIATLYRHTASPFLARRFCVDVYADAVMDLASKKALPREFLLDLGSTFIKRRDLRHPPMKTWERPQDYMENESEVPEGGK